MWFSVKGREIDHQLKEQKTVIILHIMARMHTISWISGGLGVNDGFGDVDTSSLQTAV